MRGAVALMAVVPMDAADTSFYDPDMHLIEGGESLEYVEKNQGLWL